MEQLNLKYAYDHEGYPTHLVIDIVDFKLICHQGLKKNTQFFHNVIDTLDEIDEEND